MDLHVALLGMTGSGKTTVGRAVAAAIDRPFLDSDALIADELGSTGGEIAARDSTAQLHRVEQHITRRMLASAAPAVLGVPASAVDDAGTRNLLAEGATCFWLDAGIATLARRTADGAHRRTIDVAELQRLHDRRAEHFAALAGRAFDTGTNPPDEIARRIVAAVRHVGSPGNA